MSITKEEREAIDVLDAFAEACPVPTPGLVLAWTRDHPRHAAAIRALAADMVESTVLAGEPGHDAPTTAEIEREFEIAALEAGYGDATMTFAEMVDASGVDLPTLAERLEIGVDVVIAIEEGTVILPVDPRLVAGVATIIPFPQTAVQKAMERSQERPDFALAAKMGRGATVTRRTWTEILKASHMSDERKAYWLAGT